VAADHVVLSADGREETLVLTAGTLPGRDGAGAGAAAAETREDPRNPRFGNRVGETRWENNKAAVLEYLPGEMMDNPERQAGLFNAMEPTATYVGKVAVPTA
jgi:hypothetical protein